MNSKLEVVRINEDVIATSGVCSHIGTDKTDISSVYGYANHIKVVGYEIISYVDNNQDGKLEKSHDATSLLMAKMIHATQFVNVSADGWYYWNKDTQTFDECNDNCDHPIE